MHEINEIYMVSSDNIIKGYFESNEFVARNPYKFIGTHKYNFKENIFKEYPLSNSYNEPKIIKEIGIYDFNRDYFFQELEHARVSLNLHLLKKHNESINKVKDIIKDIKKNLKEQEEIAKELSLKHIEYYI